jgi:hypothetical protein
MYVRFPLSLHNVEDVLQECGIDNSRETVRFFSKPTWLDVCVRDPEENASNRSGHVRVCPSQPASFLVQPALMGALGLPQNTVAVRGWAHGSKSQSTHTLGATSVGMRNHESAATAGLHADRIRIVFGKLYENKLVKFDETGSHNY